MRKTKILITGVAGFIGSNLLKALLAKKYEVVGIDNLSQGFIRNISPQLNNPSFEFIEGDVRDLSLLKSAVKGVDCIVHLAAYKIPRYGNALATLEINTQGTRNILEAAKDTRPKVIFASTSDVYGKNPRVPFSEEDTLCMGQTNIKRWSYAVSKMFDEHLCFAYYEEYKVPISIIRYFGGYGPNQNPTWWGGPQSVFIDCALRDRPMTIHGDGSQMRSFTYITDMIEATIKIIESPKSTGEIFNIGNTREISILELGKMIWAMLRDGEPKIEFISYNRFSGRYEDVKRRVPDVEKARKILNFKTKVQLEEGLPGTISWQKEIFERTNGTYK